MTPPSDKYDRKYENEGRFSIPQPLKFIPVRASSAKRCTVHTTYRPLHFPDSDDCFYGWRIAKSGETCLNHTVIEDLSFEAAKFLSHTFASMGELVVVTDDGDASAVISRADVALVYFIKLSCAHTK